MMPAARALSDRRVALTVVALCAVIGLADGTQLYASLRAQGLPGVTLVQVLGVGLAMWLPWALFFPVVVWLAARVPRRPRLRWAAVHLTAAVTIAALHTVIYVLLERVIGAFPGVRERPLRTLLLLEFSLSLAIQLLIYAVIVGGCYALELQRLYRAREVHAAQLERELAQSQLEALRLQLQPHFLFNSLHAIAAQVRTQRTSSAVQMISALADLLRYTLDSSGRQKVHLGQEIEVLGVRLNFR